MTTTGPFNLDYFESDQIKFSVLLWKANLKAKGADFDVLKFSQSWSYAESVLERTLISSDAAVADAALDLLQLRVLFVQHDPDRARLLGAPLPGVITAPPPESGSPDNPAPNRRYLNGGR
jgi:hypothetical protein